MTYLLLILTLLYSSQNCFSEQLTIPLGETITLEFSAQARRVDLNSAELIEVSQGRGQTSVVISAKKIGKGDFKVDFLGSKSISYNYEVVSPLALLSKEFTDISGLSAKESFGKLTVSGQISTKNDLDRFRNLKKKYPNIVIDITGQAVSSSSTVVNTLNRILQENSLSNMQAHAYGKIIALEGSAKDLSQQNLALQIANLVSPGIQNRISQQTNGGPSISIEVLFIEVKKSNDKKFGFKHGNSKSEGLGDDLSTLARIDLESKTGNLNKKIGLSWQVGGLSQFLDAIQSKHSARVLSNPKLVARSGVLAEFKSGETLYLNQNQVAEGKVIQNIYPVDAGIILKITPIIDELGQIDASISAEVSEFVTQMGGQPSKTISNIATAVTIKDGETVLLSGLISKRNSKSTGRIPLLADIPIIGELFKSRELESSQKETVILVTMTRLNNKQQNQNALSSKLWEESEDDISLSFFD